MTPSPAGIAAFIARGEVRPQPPGQTVLAGRAFELYRHLTEGFAQLAARWGAAARVYPTMMPASLLEKSDCLTSFPQHLSFVSVLDGEPTALRSFAADAPRAGIAAAGERLTGPQALLRSAVCYHVYDELAGARVSSREARVFTTHGRCFRFEREAFVPLERQWEFTMSEIVILGSEEAISRVRRELLLRTVELARRCGFGGRIVPANDPFFGGARGRALVQQARQLKHELRVTLDDGRDLAIASFNSHETHFSQPLAITLDGERPCHTSCVAFGIERWIAAFIAYHGGSDQAWNDAVGRFWAGVTS